MKKTETNENKLLRKKIKLKNKLKENIGFIFIMPGLFLVTAFKFIPLIKGIWLSMLETRGFEETKFIGLDNYARLLSDPMVRKTFLNALLVVSTLPFWILLPLILAVLLFQKPLGWKFFRATYFIPYTIAPIVVGIMFRQLLSPEGALNTFFRSLGLSRFAIAWLGGPTSSLFTLCAVALWCFFGLGVLTYLAALASIPIDILEACRLDGGNFFVLLVKVIIPMIRPTVGYWTVLCASGILVWMFPLIYALTQGGPGFATMLPEYLVYVTTFEFLDRGYGAAIGQILFIFVAIFSGLSVRYMYQEGKQKRK